MKKIISIFIVIFLIAIIFYGYKKIVEFREISDGQTLELQNKINKQQAEINEQQIRTEELQQAYEEQPNEEPAVVENVNKEVENGCSSKIKEQEASIKSRQRTIDLNNEILSDLKSSSYIKDCCKKYNNADGCKSDCEEMQDGEIKDLEALIKKQKEELTKRQQDLNALKNGNC